MRSTTYLPQRGPFSLLTAPRLLLSPRSHLRSIGSEPRRKKGRRVVQIYTCSRCLSWLKFVVLSWSGATRDTSELVNLLRWQLAREP